MSISCKCESCGKSYAVPDNLAGKQGKCKCGTAIKIPVCSSTNSPLAIVPEKSDLTGDDKIQKTERAISSSSEGIVANAAEHDREDNLKQMKGSPLKEYKVMTQKDKWFSGKFDPEMLEQAINAYAAQGWQVISVATASIPGLMGGVRDEMVVIFEREK